MIRLNKIYYYNRQHLKCTRLRKSGINTFQVVDEQGNDIILHDPKNPGTITDRGVRVINCHTCSDCGKSFLPNQIFSYVDGNNGAITKNSKEYCRECYLEKYSIPF